MEILKIHAGPITKHGEIDYEAVVKLRFVCYNFARGGVSSNLPFPALALFAYHCEFIISFFTC